MQKAWYHTPMAKVQLTPGKLVQVLHPYRLHKVPSTDFKDMNDWNFEFQIIPKEDVLMVVKVETSSSKRNPYQNVFLLWGEHLVYTSDTVDQIAQLFKEPETI